MTPSSLALIARVPRIASIVAGFGVWLLASDVWSATITVTSVANNTTVNGSVSLREAITSVNNGANLNADVVAVGAYGSNDTINFNIPGAGVQTINLALSPPSSSGALPALTRTVVIDGFTQPGSAFGAPLIELNCTGGAGLVSGINLTNVSNALIRGLVINRCAGSGILISGAAARNNRVQGNFLGPNATGTGGFFVFGNTQSAGVTLSAGATGNFVGTDGDGVSDAVEGNLISGNSSDGVVLTGAGTSGNRVSGNLIGTDATATAAIRNGPSGGTGAGVTLAFGATNNIVGTDADGVSDALEANTISGNNGGVAIGRLNTSGNRVMGNFIGTDPTGTVALPNLNDGVTISGIDVGPAGPSGNFIGTNGDGVNDAIEGNVISGNAGLGVRLATNSFNNRVSGNRIGVDVTGTAAMGNVFRAISLESGANANIIGTNGDGISDALEGNVISATTTTATGFGQGINVAGQTTVNNWIAGNRIGTNAAGTVAFANVGGGVQIASGAKTNVVGTNGDGVSDALEANIISGNTSFGVRLVSVGTTGNRVAGNAIGVNAAGSAALPNAGAGVLIDAGAANNVVGTDGNGSAGDATEGNVIAGNTTYGVRILNSGTTANTVAGNRIGVNASGADLGNGSHGVFIHDGAANTVVGGVGPRGNVIAFNGKGVVIGSSAADTPTANIVSRNSIFQNDALGIDLGDDGVTLNDGGDTDGGPNSLLNFPVVQSIAIVGASLEIEGFARPGSTIELFIASVDPTGFGEGQTYLATLVEDSGADLDGGVGSYGPGPVNGVVVGSDSTNRFRFDIALASLPGVINGTPLTMTATLNGSTSEFSPAAVVPAAADLSLTKSGPLLIQPGMNLTYTLVVSNGGPGDASGVVLEDPTPAGLTFVSATAPCASFPCAVPLLPSGSSITTTATFSAPASFRAPSILNVANLIAPGPDEPKRHAAVTTRVASADLSILKTGPQLTAVRGDQVTFDIVVRNLGPDEALGVIIDDPTPPGLTFVANDGACATAFPCALGTIPVGAIRTIAAHYTVPFDVTASVVNVATVSSTTPDPNTTNNASSTSMPRQTDLAITKTGPATAVVGQAAAFEITVRNLGPSGVATFTVTDPTPAGLSLVATTGGCSAGFPCTTGPLPVGQSLTTIATYRVEPGSVGTVLTNTATVSTPTTDLSAGNNTATATTTVIGESDTDADLLTDGCERDAGLPPGSSAGADDDNDGVTNLEECEGGTHPRGFVQQYLPEGATGSFFDAQLTLENEASVDAHVLIHYEPENKLEEHAWLLLPAGARTTLSISSFVGIASFATRVESDVPISLERTMTWMEGGGHADIATGSLSTSWFFAEGATTGGFSLYYLLQNAHSAATDVDVNFLVDGGPPVVRTYTLPPQSRTSIWVNSIPELASANISLAIRSRNLPIAAARAMYRDWNGQLHVAGGSASGAGGGSLDWYFAEGATSTFFDTWLLLANPDLADAPVAIAYYTPNGAVVARSLVVPAQRRVTVRVNDVDPSLANADVAMRVHATGGIPVIAERSMWWPSPNYYEGHQSSGALQPAPIWRFGQGLVDADSETYVLIANFAATAGRAVLTLFFDNGEASLRLLDIGATSRTSVSIGTLFPEALGRRFRFEVASVGPSLALVAERSIYTNAHGRTWGKGTNLVGTPVSAITLPPAAIPPATPVQTPP